MMSITPVWKLVETVRTRLGTVTVYRDRELRARKEVLEANRPPPWNFTRVYYRLDGRRRVYRTEDDLINAIVRGRYGSRRSAG